MAGKKKRLCNPNPEKNWGGKRQNSGFKPKWQHSPTKLIRIPEALEKDILEFAHALDENKQSEQRGMLQPENRNPKTAEEIRQIQNTLEAVEATVKKWRSELQKHRTSSPRWKKANDLLQELENDISTPWL